MIVSTINCVIKFIYIYIADKNCTLFDAKICISGLVWEDQISYDFGFWIFMSHEEPGADDHSSVDQDVLFEPILSTCHYLLKVIVFIQNKEQIMRCTLKSSLCSN